MHVWEKKRWRRGKKDWTSSGFWTIPLFVSLTAPDRLAERPGLADQFFKCTTNARHSQVGIWPLCLSAFQCVCGVNIYYKLIYTSKGKKDVSVTFSRCQIWTEDVRERTERDPVDLRDLLMYALHNLFIYLGGIDFARSWSETCWHFHTHTISHPGAAQYI